MRRHALRLLACLVVALSLPAAAQQQPMQHGRMMHQDGWGMRQGHGMTGGPMMGGMRGSMVGRGDMMGGGPGRFVEGRLAFLRTELGITEAQEDAWADYAEAVRAAAGTMQGMHDAMRSGDRPAALPERLARHEQMIAARLETLRTLREAAVPLYEALDAGQKDVADQIMVMVMGAM
jgi:hypothetical protein